MLGISRKDTLDITIQHIDRVYKMTDRLKEENPYLAIHAAPRQRKSLFLDLLCEGLRFKEYTAIAISYNSSSRYTRKEDSNVAGWFFVRIIATILKACDFPVIDFSFLSPYIDILMLMFFMCVPNVFLDSNVLNLLLLWTNSQSV